MGRLLAPVVLLLAAACAQLERAPGPDVQFELTGRLAARYGAEAFTANVAWRHGETSDEMLITNSLGAGVARIVREGGEVVLTTAEAAEYRARDAEALTEEVLGFRVPLEGLADWVRGRASPSAPSVVEYGPEGRLLALKQGGWTIEYREYERGLPSRLRLHYPGIELRLAITQWK